MSEARETPAPPADLLAWAEKERDDWQDRNADRYWQMNRVVAEIKKSGAASERAASPEVEKARCGIEQPNIELCVRCGEPAADHGEFGFRDHAPRNAAGDELPTTVTAECAARAEVTALRDALKEAKHYTHPASEARQKIEAVLAATGATPSQPRPPSKRDGQQWVTLAAKLRTLRPPQEPPR